MKAIVSITLDNEFVVHDIKVIEGPNRLFVAMPSRKDESGSFRDIVHPISSDGRASIEENILTLQEAKSRLAGQVVDEQQPSLASLSKKGLRLLLGME